MNGSILMLLSLLLVNGANAQVNLDSLLIAHWQLNGDATDASGNGFDGTVTGPVPAPDAWGDPTGAYAFDGIDDLIALPVLWSAAPDSMTFTAWFHITDTVMNGKIIYHGDNGEFEMLISGGSVACGVHLPSSWYYAGAGIQPGQWHFAAARWTKGGQIAIYMDGTEVQSTAVPMEGLLDVGAGYQPSLGSYGQGNGSFFNGRMDDVRVYGRALSDAELDSLWGDPFASIQETGRLDELTLFPNWPNPVHGSTTIAFQVDRTRPLSLRLYDPLGTLVHELANARYEPGRHEFRYDTDQLKAGTYVWELRSGPTVRTRSMVVQ